MVSLYTFKSLPDYVNVVPLSEFELYLITEINLIVIFQDMLYGVFQKECINSIILFKFPFAFDTIMFS